MAAQSLPALKIGDTLLISCTSKDELGQGLDLTGIALSCQMRLSDGTNAHDLIVTLANQATSPGVFTLSAEAADTATWQTGLYKLDIQQAIGSQVSSSSTVFLPVVDDVTSTN